MTSTFTRTITVALCALLTSTAMMLGTVGETINPQATAPTSVPA